MRTDEGRDRLMQRVEEQIVEIGNVPASDTCLGNYREGVAVGMVSAMMHLGLIPSDDFLPLCERIHDAYHARFSS